MLTPEILDKWERTTPEVNKQLHEAIAEIRRLRAFIKELAEGPHSDICASMKPYRPNYRCYVEDACDILEEGGGV